MASEHRHKEKIFNAIIPFNKDTRFLERGKMVFAPVDPVRKNHK
jgi:hypothetical protein